MFRKLIQVNRIGGREREECTDTALVTERELHDLTDLSLVFGYVFRTDTKRAPIGGFVKVRAVTGIEVSECFEFPFFTGEPGEHPAFDIGQVGYNEVLPGRGHDAGPQTRGHQFARLSQVLGPAALNRFDPGVNDVLRERRAREVLQLHEAPGVSACAGSSAELETSAHAAVRTGRGNELFIFGSGRLSGRQANAQKFLDDFRQVLIVETALDCGLSKIRQADATLLQDVSKERIALSCGRDYSISEILGALCILCLELIGQRDRCLGEIEVHPDTSIINALVDHELGTVTRTPVPRRQFFIDCPHGFHVQAAVVHKAGPILRIRRAAAHVALRVRLTEFQHEAPAVFILSLVHAEAVNLRQRAQRSGEPVTVGLDHAVIHTLEGDVDMEVFGPAQDGHVEISSVMPNRVDLGSIHLRSGKDTS